MPWDKIAPKKGDRIRVSFEATYRSRSLDVLYVQNDEGGTYAVPAQSLAVEVIEPPKPAEPTGLGAVIEDESGEHYVRAPGKGERSWVSWHSREHKYEDIKVARVLSEGVTA